MEELAKLGVIMAKLSEDMSLNLNSKNFTEGFELAAGSVEKGARATSEKGSANSG